MSAVGALFLRLKTRRRIESPLETLRSTILLDPIWYRESHPDLRGTSIDAAQHYLDYGAREGRNPHPLFDTKWYLSRTPDAAASGLNPLVHYLLRESYAGSSPHPLFDVDLYISNAHDFESSRLDPLTHYLTIGWKQGIHPSKFFDPGWYLEQYPDVRAADVEPLSHYLQWGWREDRWPNSEIDPIAYRERNGLPRDTNPLLDFALFGEKRSTQESPSNQNSGDSLAREIPSKMREVGIVSAEPERMAVAAGSIAEPGIRPPMPVAAVDNRQHARDIEIVSAIRDLQSKNRGEKRSSTQRLLREDEIKIISAKLELAGADNVLPLESVGAAVKASANANEGRGRVALDALLGLGITPHCTVDESCFPTYPVPILNRYNQGRLDAGRRFSLDPSLAGRIDFGPTISILVPVYKTPIVFLERAILSVLFQTYANWELILVDDFSQQPDIEALLKHYASVDPRVKVHFCGKNGGISAATNEALKIASGSHIGLLDHDDMLTRDALEKVADCLVKDKEVDLVYTDECKIDRDDLVDNLFHKPDWSPLLLLNFMYTGHFSVYRKTLVHSVGGFRSEFDFSQDYDLALRVVEQQPKVTHIEECLYGWRMIAGSAAIGDKPTARLSNVAALQDAADRRGYDGVAVALPTANRVKRWLKGHRPLVSIVVPSDNFSNIRDSVNSIVSHSTYENYEIIVVTNSELIATYGGHLASPITRIIKYDEPYNFSDKCNAGAARASGEHVVFFNDDVRVISPDWIETLLEYLTLPGVGVVGPKLIYENGSIQHAGMVTGVRRLVGTAFHAYPADTTAYFNFAQSVRETSLISAACLAMPIEVFREIGGFDSGNVPIAHSDVDLCFRVRASGRSCIYTPHAQLTHIGHLSIGSAEAEARKKAKPFRKDKADLFLLKKWGRYLERDPYFPPKMRDLVYIDSQESFSYRRSSAATATNCGLDFILFSHDLSASGAPRVLYDMAKALIDAGHYVLVISPEDGMYGQRLLDVGADVIIDPLALSGHPAVIDLAKNFDIAICNTILWWSIPSKLQRYLPVYLYTHESQLIRHYVENVPGFREGLSATTAIWAAGPLVVSAIREQCGLEAQNIEGCVEELDHFAQEDPYSGATVIAVVGTYESRKGQDLAIQGFNMLTPERRVQSRLVMAGRTNNHEFREDLKKLADASPCIVFHEELNHAEVAALMSRADIVLVPSRDDPLPLVSMEALAAGKILVCSKTTGTAAYIVDGESGFLLHENGPEDICATLERVFEQMPNWPRIGANARRVYEAHFTPRAFNARLFRALGLAQASSPTEAS
jgi:GT2 family glycosyltransferase/glycosyltransferase involved in cell wall biosynthesis